MHRHHPDVEVLDPTLRIWVEESQMLEKGIGLFLGVHVVLMLSRSVGAAESRLSPVLRCDLVLSTEFTTASINLRGNIVWPACSSTAFIKHAAWSSTRFSTFEVWPHQLLAQAQSSSLHCPQVHFDPLPLLLQHLVDLAHQLSSWRRWVEANTICWSVPGCFPHHLLPPPLLFLPTSRSEERFLPISVGF